MKRISLLCALLAPLLVGLTGAAPTDAPDGPQLPPPILDNDEMMQLVKARQQVLTANPDLLAEEKKLKALHEAAQKSNPPPTAEQRNADFAEWKQYQKTMRAAMLKVDPTLGPIFAKLDAARQHGAPAPFQPATPK